MLTLSYNQATCKENSTVEQDLELCEKYGYKFIELRLDMLQTYLQDHTYDDLRAFFSTHQLKPFALNSIEQINFCSSAEWNERVELFTFACEVCREIKNPYIVVVPTVREDMLYKTEAEIFADSVDVLNKLADIAEPYGAKLAFEPIGDLRWCCRSQRQALEIIQAVDRDNIGLVVDCINFYMHDKCSDLDFLGQLPPEKVFVFHINDCEDVPLGVLDHCHRIMPGQGCIPIRDIVAALKSIGYNGPASLELFRPEYWAMPAEDVFRLGRTACLPYL
ncbi:MAG TPA: sugar phosphate isomerase/epimerase [Clostridiaceae bacterium]|nr:sugar phosphate isomerase/epimerase [Clostridiaceae bacterium]